MPHLRLVIRVLSDEIHAFLKEIFFLKLWTLGEWMTLNWLKILLRSRRGDNNCSLGVEHDESIVLVRCILLSILLRVRNFSSWYFRLRRWFWLGVRLRGLLWLCIRLRNSFFLLSLRSWVSLFLILRILLRALNFISLRIFSLFFLSWLGGRWSFISWCS